MPLDPWYVTGLSESGASFTFSRSGRQIAVYFSIRAGARELSWLEEIRVFFGGAGTIYPTGKPGPASSGSRQGGGYYYRVCRREEIAGIVEHFDRHPLRGSKREAYAAWRELALLKQRFRGAQRGEMEALAARLSEVARGGGERA